MTFIRLHSRLVYVYDKLCWITSIFSRRSTVPFFPYWIDCRHYKQTCFSIFSPIFCKMNLKRTMPLKSQKVWQSGWFYLNEAWLNLFHKDFFNPLILAIFEFIRKLKDTSKDALKHIISDVTVVEIREVEEDEEADTQRHTGDSDGLNFSNVYWIQEKWLQHSFNACEQCQHQFCWFSLTVGYILSLGKEPDLDNGSIWRQFVC